MPVDAAVFGEIALSGELRPVAHSPWRLKEAGKLGFERALLPSAVTDDTSGLTLTGFRTLGGSVEHLFGK